jgi:Ca2+-dependent lipid-binding protein
MPPSIGIITGKLQLIQYGTLGGLTLIWMSVAFGSGVLSFLWRTIIISVLGFVITTAASLVERNIEKELERVRQDLSRQRGEAYSPPMPESVEWLNGLIKLIWGLVDP